MSGPKGGAPATQQATTAQTNAPWSGALPYITSGLQSAQNLYSQGGPQYYPGQTYAPENSGEQSAINSLEGLSSQFAPTLSAAQSGVSNATNTAQLIGGSSATDNPSNSFFTGLTTGSNSIPGLSTLNNYANGSMLSAQNPYFQQMANTVTSQVLPGINSQFANSGEANSGQASRAAGLGVGDAVGGLAYNNYQQGLTQQQTAANSLAGYGITGAQGLASNYQNNVSNQINAGNLGLNAAQLAPLLQAMGLNADNAGLTAGQTQQGLDQQPITAAMNQYNYNQNLPYQNLQNYIANITGQIGGTGQTTGTNTTTATPATTPWWQQGLSTGLAAASFFA